MKPGIHQRSKRRCQDLCWKVHDRVQAFFSLKTLCKSYVTKTFLFISSSVVSKQLLCFVYCRGQNEKKKHTTKNFVEFHNHSPLLTLSSLTFYDWQMYTSSYVNEKMKALILSKNFVVVVISIKSFLSYCH